MAIKPNFLFGNVMHARLIPKTNKFTYKIYYLASALSERSKLPIKVNKLGFMSFHDRDHGPRDGSDLEKWCRSLLSQYGLNKADGEIILITMPRVFGYVFNPISFWLCLDKKNNLRAVICEVNNTFGEHHTYLCAHPDQRPIVKEDSLEAEKLFHVSPLLKREGHYTFRFDWGENHFAAYIDYYNADNKKQLITSLKGDMQPMENNTIAKAFWTYPLITLKAITLIHWQALKLLVKGIRYIRKPDQLLPKKSTTKQLTKT